MSVTDPPREPLPVRLEHLPRDRHEAVLEVDTWTFPAPEPDHDLAPMWDALDWDRSTGAYVPTEDGDRLAGINSTYAFDLTVPGSAADGGSPRSVPCAGLTWVGVHPQFRRRGVLTAMMHAQLRGVRERGHEPVGALFASEPVIYGRFGYGLATHAVSMVVASGAELLPVRGSDAVDVRYETASVEAHTELIREVYERSRLRRPGGVSRPNPGTTRNRLHDPPERREGREVQRILIASRRPGPGAPATPTGYALVRRKLGFDPTPDGEVVVRELAAVDAASEHALWTRLLNFDLMTRVVATRQPVDGGLTMLLANRDAAAPRWTDGLWVRLVDLPRALEARGYAGESDAVLAVRDRVLPENDGVWRLRTGQDGARCTPSTERPDVTLDVRDLGSAYLGGTSLTALAGAGRVDAPDPAGERFARLSAAFGSALSPCSPWEF